MPTISTESIEGFDSMTTEQKVEALLKVEVPERIDLSGYVKKDLFDKTASELAEAKKTIKGRCPRTRQPRRRLTLTAKRWRTNTQNCCGSPPLPSTLPVILLCRVMTRN